VAIGKSAAERDAHFKSLRVALQQLAEARARLLVSGAAAGGDGVRVIVENLREENPELLLPLATELAKHEHTVALLVHEGTGQLVFAQHPTAGKDLAALLKRLLSDMPGKGGGTRDFVRAKLADTGTSLAALEAARSLLTR
jgi:alanyl-tRNA synthetase